MKGERLPWIITCLALLGMLVLGGILWRRDAERTQFTTVQSRALHDAAQRKEAEADTLRSQRMRTDALYRQQFADFTALMASLEQVARSAADHDAAIRRAPVDSLPTIVRRLLAEYERRGLVP